MSVSEFCEALSFKCTIWSSDTSKENWSVDSDKLNAEFKIITASLLKNMETIVQELINVQGQPSETDGYFLPNAEKTDKAMRPSATLNKIIG